MRFFIVHPLLTWSTLNVDATHYIFLDEWTGAPTGLASSHCRCCGGGVWYGMGGGDWQVVTVGVVIFLSCKIVHYLFNVQYFIFTLMLMETNLAPT